MANTKSAKKSVKQTAKRRKVNLARRTAIKTAVKKVIVALEKGESADKTRELLNDVAAKLYRARGKNTIHANTAARKLSRLAKRVAASEKKAE